MMRGMRTPFLREILLLSLSLWTLGCQRSSDDAARCTTTSCWSLPGGDKNFNRIANGECGVSTNPYSTFDIDGDRLPDLVVTSHCNSGTEGVGSNHWLVYRNTGSGFSASPIEWPLPGGDQNFYQIRNDDCSAYSDIYSTLDMDGDLRPDLVLTSKCSGSENDVGSKHWLVYRNTGSAFAASPVEWSLPGGDLRFSDIANSECAINQSIYSTIDMDGDLHPDLVVTSKCSGGEDGIGSKHWLVYRNNGSGFSATPL